MTRHLAGSYPTSFNVWCIGNAGSIRAVANIKQNFRNFHLEPKTGRILNQINLLHIFTSYIFKCSNPCRDLDRPWGFQDVEAPRISRQSSISLTHRPPSPTGKYSWYPFLLKNESTPEPLCGRKDYVNEKFQLYQCELNPRPSGL